VTRFETASFTVQGGLVRFLSNMPGRYATLFANGERLQFRDDASSFDDLSRSYAWAFSYAPPLPDGMQFVFATAEREVVGESDKGQIHVTGDFAHVERSRGGEPTALLRPPTPIVEFTAITCSGHLPKVSVVTCSYNRPTLLREAIESLRKQTDDDWEHLIYDDASTSPGVAEVLAWAKQDRRVRIWKSPVNLDRPAVRWNFMLDRAHGRYLTVLDDDNRKLPRFVEVMSAQLDSDPTLDLVTCGWVVVRPDGNCEADYHLNLSTCESELNRISTCDGGAMLYRRSTFERAGYFAEEIRTNEDWDWLRRAMSRDSVRNLHECLSTYRSHDDQRMRRADQLGNAADVDWVRSRALSPTITVRPSYPSPARLTQSQRDVVECLDRALQSIPWVRLGGGDLALVVSPFQMSDAEVQSAVSGCSRALSLHMEDPYALGTNLERVRAMKGICPSTWVCTNDASALGHYQEIVGRSAISCPSLGADAHLAALPAADRDLDVLLCGYAYPSRQRFVRALLPHLGEMRVLLCGDGWESFGSGTVQTTPTQSLADSYVLHTRARAVICLQRVHGDCADGPAPPQTVNRGYMEGALGPRVFLDRSRARHALDEGDVLFYSSPEDLAQKLRIYLTAKERDPRTERFRDKCRLLYTYRTRLARAINCVRAPRFLAEIP